MKNVVILALIFNSNLLLLFLNKLMIPINTTMDIL